MANKRFEQQLTALEELRGSGGTAAVDGLRKAVANRNNYIVAKAAGIAAELGFKSLVPDLLAAFDRFLVDPVKSDPQCWAKNALAQALAALGHEEARVYARGLRHVQMEAVWGGKEDTAGALRGHCALALVSCRDMPDIEVLSHLLEALTDRDKTVRVAAARAIGRMGRPEAALLLRLRALMGDEEPEALGACLSAMLSIEGKAGIEFAGRFLDRDGDAAAEAAFALGLMRDLEALEVLRERWKRERDPSLAGALLSAIAVSRLPEAIGFLTQLIEADSASAADALSALASAGVPAEVRSRIGAAVDRSGNAKLHAEFEKQFPID